MQQIEEQRLARLNENLNAKKTNDNKQYNRFHEEFEKDEDYRDTEISPEEFKEIRAQTPEIPHFPLLIFTIAMLKDFIDIMVVFITVTTAGMGLVLTVIVWIITAIMAAVIWLWIFNKSTFIRKWIIKKAARRIALFFLIKITPLLYVAPTASLTVYLVYKSESGFIGKIIDAVEKVEKIV